MFLSRILLDGPDGPEARLAVTGDPDDGWLDVRAAEQARLRRQGATEGGARRVATALAPSSLTAALGTGAAFTELLARVLADGSGDAAPIHAPVFTLPIDAPGYRDFMAFERHFRFGSELRGLPVPDVLYELPVSYFGNHFGLLGPDQELAWPHYSEHMDYELELGIVIGRGGRDLDPTQALEHVLGVTILNDFSARDIQFREMQGGLGPSKGKHFGSALGPWIATLDELPPAGLRMQAFVNDELWSDTTSAEMIWSIGELVAFATAAEEIVGGTVLGTGTANGGSAVELGRRLAPGDEVALVVDRLGSLRTRLGAPGRGWMPEPRLPASR